LVASPTDFATEDELRGNGAGIYHLADGVPDEVFEKAIAQAKAESNLSRANLVRKIHQRPGPSENSFGPGESAPEPADRAPETAQVRRDLIARLAAERLTSRQIAARLQISDQRVREIARKHRIAIPADAVTGRSRRIDSTRIVRETAHAMEGLVMGIELADLAELDPADAAEWAASIAQCARSLARFARQIKEVAR
jgi:hypothetical protein